MEIENRKFAEFLENALVLWNNKLFHFRLVSDNFVKIDLRKKTYVRGLKKLTGAQMKRREWKKKTAFERPIKTSKTGKSICFKCGGEGHWAKFCKEHFKKKVNPFKYVILFYLRLKYLNI